MADDSITKSVSNTAYDILSAVNAIYEQEGVALPERQYIATGDVAFDCEQLTVSFQQLYAGTPGQPAEQPVRCNQPFSAVWEISLVRCIPVARRSQVAPTTDELDATAEGQMADAMLLLTGVMSSDSADWLGAFADVTVTEPDGGFQAVVCRFTCGIA